MLMKIGERPTMGGGGGVTVEVGGGCHMAVGLGVGVGTIVLLLGGCDLEKPGLGGFSSAAHPATSEARCVCASAYLPCVLVAQRIVPWYPCYLERTGASAGARL